MRTFNKEQIKVPNQDIINTQKEQNTNTGIVQFLTNLGETSAALYLEKKLSVHSNVYSKELEKIEKEKNEEIKKISMINSGILDKLETIEKSLRKEQDTSVEKVIKKEKAQSALQIVRNENTKQQEGSNWFTNLLGGLLGAGMLAFLMGFKNLGPMKFAMKMVEMGWGAVKDKIVSLITSISTSIMKPVSELVEWILQKLSKIPGFEEFGDKVKKTKTEKPKIQTEPTSPKAKVNPTVDSTKLANTIEKGVEEKAAKTVGKGVGKSALKKIPFLGLGLSGAFAADRINEGDYVGAAMEISSGVLSTLGAFSFGLGTAGSIGVDAAIIARDVKRQNDYIITKLDDSGIIDKGFFGDTTVEDWDKVRNLDISELKALYELDDLNQSDKNKVQGILYKKQLEQIKVPEDIDNFNESGVKVIFNEREILADKVLASNDELQDFLLKNPFNDDNSIKSEKYINGEKVTEIKYKDEALNEEYIKLKMQYDEDFAKYKESREAQLRNLGDMYDIDGYKFSEDEFNKYQTVKGNTSVSSFYNSIVMNSAQNDINGAFQRDLSNITIPTGELAERIKQSEGLRLNVYKDTEGYDTIGYGHKLKPGEDYLRNGITTEQAEQLFAQDFDYHYKAAMKIPSFNKHPKEVQDALVDMTYNMGPTWYKSWNNTMKLLENQDYKGVANVILNSKYARQVKGRALVNAKLFEMAGDSIKTASNNITTPQNNVAETPEINVLNKNNAIEQKQAKAQLSEDINKNLVKNSSSQNIINNYNTSNNSSTSANVESKPLSSVFNTYT